MSASLQPQVVLLFTAAAKDKPMYRRGVLDALAYPSGHIIDYSYRAQQVQESLRTIEQVPHHGAAVIVLVDEAADHTVTYFPLRRVKILAGLPFPRNQEIIARERRRFSLELGDFVAYAHTQNPRQWNIPVSEFDAIREIKGNKPTFFVIQARDIFRAAKLPPLATAWEDVVVNVAQSNTFSQASFVRVDHLKDSKTNDMLPNGNLDNRAYLLRPGSLSRLNITVYDRSASETKVEIKSSSEDLFSVNQPFQSVVSGLAEKTAFIACKRTVEDRTAILSIEVVADANASNVVNSPNPVLLIKTALARGTVLWFVFLALFGAFFVSWDPELVRQLWCTPQYKFWGLAAKGFGAALLTRAAWLAFRKLPSGGTS
jgi:hypothetical protein